GLHDKVHGGFFAGRSLLAVARNGAVDQTRMTLMKGAVAKAQAVHGAGAEIFDKYVHLINEAQTKLQAFALLEIDGNPLLAAVESEEETGQASGEGRTPAAAHVAGARFEFVDCGSVVRKQQRAIGTGEGVREIEHANSMKGGRGGWHGRGVSEPDRR